MPENPYAGAYRQFKANTKDHQLTVLHDDGLYRHLRMGKPGTGMWSWNVVTFPWHVYIGGDIGDGFVFSREEDMLRFMDTSKYGDYYGDGSPHLQADYWAEKLDRACRDRAESYDDEQFRKNVRTRLADAVRDGDITRGKCQELRWSLDSMPPDKDEAYQWLRDEASEVFSDWWEWDLKSLDHHYLLGLYAIVTTIKAYRAHKEALA